MTDKVKIETEGETPPPKKPSKMNDFIQKLKCIKHIEVIVAIIVIAVIILAYTCIDNGMDNINDVSNTSPTLTQEMQKILSKIKGVGNVDILIVYNGGTKLEIASKIDKHTDKIYDGNRTTEILDETITPVIVEGDKPLVIGEQRAEIDGVVVVAEGGKDSKVRLQIMQAVSLLLKIDYSCINVFEMK